MLVIGSQALHRYGLLDRPMGKDLDVIATRQEIDVMVASTADISIIEDTPDKVIFKTGEMYVEADLDTVESNKLLLKHCNAEIGVHYAPTDVLYLLKMSHRFKKDSPHFYKTMHDIRIMRRYGAAIPPELEEWYSLREEETYDYTHPNLKVSKDDFFNGDEVPYEYDHDSIHVAIAYGYRPAYMEFKPEDNEVYCSRDLFFRSSDKVKLLSVYEEACVLALERSIVPFDSNPDKMFRYALMKLCTSISSGWWREWAWDHHDEVIAFHEKLGGDWFYNQFNKNIDNLAPYRVA